MSLRLADPELPRHRQLEAPRRLSSVHRQLRAALAAGDWHEAGAAFHKLVGLVPEELPSELTPPRRTTTLIRYRQPSQVDRLALLHGGRNVVKFEDLELPQARELEDELASHGLRTVRAGPYDKCFELAEASRTRSGAFYSVYASRAEEARAVAAAERFPAAEGTRRAGLALGYPSCCVESFIEAERSKRAYYEGVNEAAIRWPLGQGSDAPWQMNLLSSLSPIGFVPCSLACSRALEFADRVLAAVGVGDPGFLEEIEATLRRPVLFFRYPLHFVFEGAEPSKSHSRRGIRYREAIPVKSDSPGQDALLALGHTLIGQRLAQGDELALDEDRLEVLRDGRRVWCWQLAEPSTPMLLRFS